MLINLKVQLIKIFTANKIDADKEIIKFLSRKTFLERKYKVELLLNKLDNLKKTKTDIEFQELAEIMLDYVQRSNKRILQEFKQMDGESQKLMLNYAPEEYKSALSKIQKL
jgi:GTP-binding protein EngB required for normal cell division